MLSLSDIDPTHSASMIPMILSSSPCQHGLLGEYYQDVNPRHTASAAHLGQSPSVLAYIRADDNIDFSWGHGPAGLNASAGFSIRWTGFLQMPPYGWPEFETVRDDGLRFYINGTSVIDAWNNTTNHTDTSNSYEYASSPSPVPIRLEYYENGTPPATVKLLWYDYSQSKYVPVPSQSLYNGSPPAKTSLSAQPGDGHVLLSWQPPAGANENTSYNLLRSVNGSDYALQTTTTNTSYDDPNVTDGTLYSYIVVAVCPCGSSDASDAVSARPVPPAPNSPTGLTATAVSKTEVDLTWGALAGVNGYSLERSPNGSSGWVEIASPTQNVFPDTGGLNSGTTYYYRVRAWQSNGSAKTYSGYSNTAHATTRPDAPVLSASTAGGQVSLSWTAVRNAVSYNLYRSSTSGGETLYRTGLTGLSSIDTGVVVGQPYFYQITAVVIGPDVTAESDRSNEVQATQVPNPPTGLVAQAASKTEIDLKWGGSPGASGYSLERSPDGVSTWVEVAQPAQTLAPDAKLNSGTTYYYRVRAWQSNGSAKTYSGYSNTAHATTPPDAPVLSASTAGGQVSLSWTAVRNAVSYKLYRSSISGGESPYRAGLTGQTFVDTSVVGGHQYFYKITAVVSGPDGAIEGDRSNEVQAGLIPCILPGLDAQQGLLLSPASVVGGTTGGGLVTLSGPALTGGQVVTLSSSNSLATVPGTVLVPSGSTIAAFLFKTRAVTAPASVMITASTHGSVARQTLAVVPFTPIPQVPEGGSATFPAIGSDNPPASSPNTWEIVDPDGVTVLAGDATGINGWNAARDTTTNDLTVYAPWGSGGKKNYEVRFRDQVGSLTSAYFDVLSNDNRDDQLRAKATPRIKNAEPARVKASSKH